MYPSDRDHFFIFLFFVKWKLPKSLNWRKKIKKKILTIKTNRKRKQIKKNAITFSKIPSPWKEAIQVHFGKYLFPLYPFKFLKKIKTTVCNWKKTNLITLTEASDILVVRNKLFSEYFRNILNDLFAWYTTATEFSKPGS